MKKSGQLIKKSKGASAPKSKQNRASTSSTSSNRVTAPVAMSRRVKTSAPRITTKSNGDIHVHHREYVQDLAGSVAFASTSLPINPGQVLLFPWLSQIAQRYESYRFNSLRFCLETTSPTTATGSVILAVDFDAADDAPVSKIQAMSYRSSVRGAPWDALEQNLLPEDLHKLPMNYVRTTVSLPANLDIKTYDIGNLIMITQGQAGTSSVSELYVEYDVNLITPQIDASTNGFFISGSAGLTAVVGFGTNAAIDAQSTVPISINTAGDTLTFLSNFSGVITAIYTGTVLGPVATVGSTATIDAGYHSAGTNNTAYMVLYRIVASPGQTLKVQLTETTFTGALYLGTVFDPRIINSP
jgi:hypothetical protein